jgi:hypothetical protein
MLALNYFALTMGTITAGVVCIQLLDSSSKSAVKSIAVFSLKTAAKAFIKIADWLDGTQPPTISKAAEAQQELLKVISLMLERQEATENAICSEITSINERFNLQSQARSSSRAREFATSRAIRADVDRIKEILLAQAAPLKNSCRSDGDSTMVSKASKYSGDMRMVVTHTPLRDERRVASLQLQDRCTPPRAFSTGSSNF